MRAERRRRSTGARGVMGVMGVMGAAAVLALVALLGACATPPDDGAPPAAPGASTTAPTTEPTTDSPPAPTGTPTLPTEVTALLVEVDSTGEGDVRTMTLTCGPPGGDHPDPDAACAVLATEGARDAFAPVPRDLMCTQVYGGPQRATVRGTVDGRPVRATLSRTDGCEIGRWNALAVVLDDPGGGL